MHLFHYVFITWIQYEMLTANFPAFQKGVTTFVATLPLSWGTVAGIRLIPPVGRILTGAAQKGRAGQNRIAAYSREHFMMAISHNGLHLHKQISFTDGR